MESGISEALETGRAWQSQSQRKIKEGKQGKQARARERGFAFFRPPLQSTTAHRGASTSIGRFTFAYRRS